MCIPARAEFGTPAFPLLLSPTPWIILHSALILCSLRVASVVNCKVRDRVFQSHWFLNFPLFKGKIQGRCDVLKHKTPGLYRSLGDGDSYLNTVVHKASKHARPNSAFP